MSGRIKTRNESRRNPRRPRIKKRIVRKAKLALKEEFSFIEKSNDNISFVGFKSKDQEVFIPELFGESKWKKEVEKKMFPKNLGPKGESFSFFLNRQEIDRNLKIYNFKAMVYKVNTDTNDWEMMVARNVQEEQEHKRLSVEFVPFKSSERSVTFGKIIVKETWNNEVLFSFLLDIHYGLSVLDENYHDSGNSFISIFSSDNENYGFVLSQDESNIFSQRLEAICMEMKAKKGKKNNQDLQKSVICVGINASNGNDKVSLVLGTNRFFCSHLYPLLKHCLDNSIGKSIEDLKTMFKKLLTSINTIKLPTFGKDLNYIEKKVLRWTISDEEKLYYKTEIEFFGKKFKFFIKVGLFEDEIGDEKLSITKLLIKFKEKTMEIYNAIFQEKRILFYSKNQSISEIARAVFSCVLIVAPPLTGFFQHKVFPYVTTDDMTFSKVPGYIGGSNDADFEKRDDVWDIFCNLDSGEIKKNSDLDFGEVIPGYVSIDNKFCIVLREIINQHMLRKLKSQYTEYCLKSNFYTFTMDLINMAVGKTEDTSVKNAIETNYTRINNWKKTFMYAYYLQDLERRKHISTIEKVGDLEKYITQIRIGQNVSDDVVLKLMKILSKINTKEQIIELLSFFPLAQGGLYPIAVLLFHKNLVIRQKVTAVLQSIETVTEGFIAISQLSVFLQIAFDRNVRQANLRNEIKSKNKE